jgi:hypothetical protein
LRYGGIELIAVVSDGQLPHGFHELPNVTLHFEPELWVGAMRQLRAHQSVDAVLILRVGAYIECNPVDALQFHFERSPGIVRAFDANGPLDFWVVDPRLIPPDKDLLATLTEVTSAPFRISGHVNRLENADDLRRLAVDGLSSRCALRPQGFEVRPGVWMGERVQIEKGTRIVAPAFIGSDVTISEQCLITRCTTVERHSHVDYGTVVEDSSVLSNTYVGIGLDLSHSVVDGNILLNLRHDVMLEVGDPAVMRRNKPQADTDRHLWTAFGPGELAPSAVEKGKD